MIQTVQGTIEYKVDTDKMTCTCPHFKYRCSSYPEDDPRRICKHLAKFNLKGKKRFTRAFAEDVLNELSILNSYEHVVCGSYRRGLATVGDIDVLILTDNFFSVVSWVEDRYKVLWSGSEKVSFMFGEIQVDFRRTDPQSLVTSMMYFTGSKNENIRLRIKASKLGLKLNEYGLWDGDDKIDCDSEEAVYKVLGMEFKAPRDR